MGKQFGGVFANWSGKVGNVVGAVRQGRTIMRIYQPMVANPKTPSQLDARAKFGVLVKGLSKIAGFLRVGFHDLDGYKTGNPFSAAVGYNSEEAVSGSYPNYEMDWSKTVVAQGPIDLPYAPSVTADGTTLSLTWADNSGMGNALADDQVMVCALNTDKGQSVYNTSLADRNERNGQLVLPSAWSGDSVDIWLAMRRPSSGACSMSDHVAVLSL